MAVVKATAEDLEKDARDYFTRHCGDLPRYERYGTMVVASTWLVKAVVQLLTAAGVEVAEAPPIRTVPGEDHLQYAALTGDHNNQPVLVPLIPGSPAITVFVPGKDTKVGEPVAKLTVPPDQVERSGWVPAAAIAEQLQTILGPTS